MVHVPPFWETADFWTTFLVALVGGGGLGGIITALIGRRKAIAESDNLSAETAKTAVGILTDDVIGPLRDQLQAEAARADALEARVGQLEEEERGYVSAVRYIRSLCHWLDPAVTAIDPVYMAAHPKPRLPADLRATIANEKEPA